ncbi:MAG: tyrosine-type recombinase/integrase [Erysipelotrichaceae bacterium]|nr:tyrosine-type recombinase/integrase [Erysipelotrichaceae bacterium]
MKNLYELLEDYILKYLPLERGYSKNTVVSYYTSIKQFIEYLKKDLSIKQENITVYDFGRKNVGNYLLHIEENGNSISTRNQRRASLISFVSYCTMIEPLYQNVLDDIRLVRPKKDVRHKLDFLTVEEYKDFISVIDLNSFNGLRHYTLINLMYDSAARVSEVINIRTEDLSYGSNNSIRIKGKGNKYRIVYITSHTVKLIDDYLKKYEISEGYLFLNKQKKKMSRFGVEFLVNRYYDLACKKCPALISKNVTPHTFRHTKACHMLINGTSLPVIQRFLGHSSVSTTEIYLDLTSDAVIKAVEKAAEMIGDDDSFVEAKWKDDEIRRKLEMVFQKE